MKGVKCSWVDMNKIREALSSVEHGDGSRLAHMRCVENSTVSTWKTVIGLLSSIDGKIQLTKYSHFQPTHGYEIARSFKKRSGKSVNWDEDTKNEVVDWIERCEAEELTVAQLRDLLRDSSQQAEGSRPPDGGCNVEDLRTLSQRGFRYGTIYADPPWKYDNQATRASTSNHYGTMTVEEIAALPVKDLAADEAHLHLWTTNAFLFDCPKIMEAWGFTFKSMFVWKKPQMGLGNYWRINHEIMLTGVRGSLPFRDHSLLSCEEFERGEHSSKPEQVRLNIMKASPGPYLELFARIAYPGWSVWGNQVDKADLFRTPNLEAV